MLPDTSATVRSIAVAITKAPRRDEYDWLLLAAAPIAAWLGAIVGGRLARQAGNEALRKEWEQRRADALWRLRARVRSNLIRVIALCEKVIDHKSTEPIDLAVGEGLEVAWNLYYRVAEPIFQLGPGDLPERVDAFFVRTHEWAEKIKILEDYARHIRLARQTESDIPRRELPVQRQKVLQALADMGKEAEELLAEVKATEQATEGEKEQ